MKREIFSHYVDEITAMFGITKEDLFSKNRRRELVDARHLLYYLCSTRPMQIIYIQRFLSEVGYESTHPPIIHGIKVVTERMKSDPDYRLVIKKIQESEVTA